MSNNIIIWEELLQNEEYRKLIDKLPEDEREMVVKSLKDLVAIFENGIIKPIKNLQDK